MPLPAAEGAAAPLIDAAKRLAAVFLDYEIRNFHTKTGRFVELLLNCPQFGIAVQLVGVSLPHANLVNSNAVRAVRRRGNVNNGRNYGPRFVNANNAPSNGNWNYGSGLIDPYSSQVPCILSHYLHRFSKVPARGSKYHPTGIGLVGCIPYISKALASPGVGVWESKG